MTRLAEYREDPDTTEQTWSCYSCRDLIGRAGTSPSHRRLMVTMRAGYAPLPERRNGLASFGRPPRTFPKGNFGPAGLATPQGPHAMWSPWSHVLPVFAYCLRCGRSQELHGEKYAWGKV